MDAEDAEPRFALSHALLTDAFERIACPYIWPKHAHEYDFWPPLANHKWPKVLLKDPNIKLCRRAAEGRTPI